MRIIYTATAKGVANLLQTPESILHRVRGKLKGRTQMIRSVEGVTTNKGYVALVVEISPLAAGVRNEVKIVVELVEIIPRPANLLGVRRGARIEGCGPHAGGYAVAGRYVYDPVAAHYVAGKEVQDKGRAKGQKEEDRCP